MRHKEGRVNNLNAWIRVEVFLIKVEDPMQFFWGFKYNIIRRINFRWLSGGNWNAYVENWLFNTDKWYVLTFNDETMSEIFFQISEEHDLLHKYHFRIIAKYLACFMQDSVSDIRRIQSTYANMRDKKKQSIKL